MFSASRLSVCALDELDMLVELERVDLKFERVDEALTVRVSDEWASQAPLSPCTGLWARRLER